MKHLTLDVGDAGDVPLERIAVQDQPVCVKMPKMWQDVVADPSLTKEMALFQSDCAGSSEFSSQSGRACKFS
eukprot:10265810-Lingulodinium_polyedra.AAC.1